MTQDPYQLDDHSLELSTEHDSDGEYDGLDLPDSSHKSARGKTGLIILLMLLVLAGGGYATYALFLDPGDSFQPANFAPPLMPAPEAEPEIAENPELQEAPAYPEDGVIDQTVNATEVLTEEEVAALDAMPDATGFSEETVILPNGDTVAENNAQHAAAVAENNLEASEETPSEEPIVTDLAPAAITAPAPNLLTPIDPSAPTPEPSITQAPKSDAASKIDAINDILGQDILPQENPTAAQANALNKIDAVNEILQGEAMPAAKLTENYIAQTEVTPRAKQAIVVTRNYSAQSPQAVVVAGDRVLQAGEYAAAAKIYESQLQKNPSDPIALAGKAQALQRSGQTEQAMDTYQRLIDLNPRDIEALTNYLGLLQQHEPQEALNRLKMLEQQYPENAAVAGQIGMVHARMMDTPAALRYLNKAYALDPVNPTYPFNTAILYDRLGTTDKARDYYRMALDLTRNYPDRGNAVPVEVIRQRLGSIGN